jgi:outer membrane protein TolC
MVIRVCVAAAVVVCGTPVSVFGQSQAGTGQQPAGAAPVRRLTADDAVRLALENNLGIQVARIDPQLEDLNILGARAGWAPAVSSTIQTNSNNSPNQNFLSGSQGGTTSSDQFTGNVSLQQTLRWGGNYSVGLDNSRLVSNSSFSTFSPQLRSSVALSYSQPLLRNFGIDSTRQQLQVSTKNREIADVALRETVATTTRTVRNAYWDLAYAVTSLAVQRQSLDLAEESLRNTRARVEIGTTPPIDIVAAESEVAARQEAVIVAEAQIATTEDTLRSLIFNPSAPDFWTIRIEPSELPPFRPSPVNVDAAIQNALDQRTDLERARKSIEADAINEKFYRNQTLPDVSANIDYSVQGLGGTQLQRGFGPFGPGTGEVTGELQRGLGSVLSDVFTNDFPTWTASLNISYPLGTSAAEASLARVRLQQSQAQTQLRSQQLQVMTQVRQAARQVQTNQQRVQSTQAARQLAERQLEAEERKFEAGTSTSFQVFQTQRDLAQARNNELQAVLDYNRSIVDLDTVQEVPLR